MYIVFQALPYRCQKKIQMDFFVGVGVEGGDLYLSIAADQKTGRSLKLSPVINSGSSCFDSKLSHPLGHLPWTPLNSYI